MKAWSIEELDAARARGGRAYLEFLREEEPTYEPLMGWTSSGDTKQQVRLVFPTKEEAVAFALKEGIAFEVKEDEPKRMEKKSYADNFRWGAKESWTH